MGTLIFVCPTTGTKFQPALKSTIQLQTPAED